MAIGEWKFYSRDPETGVVTYYNTLTNQLSTNPSAEATPSGEYQGFINSQGNTGDLYRMPDGSYQVNGKPVITSDGYPLTPALAAQWVSGAKAVSDQAAASRNQIVDAAPYAWLAATGAGLAGLGAGTAGATDVLAADGGMFGLPTAGSAGGVSAGTVGAELAGGNTLSSLLSNAVTPNTPPWIEPTIPANGTEPIWPGNPLPNIPPLDAPAPQYQPWQEPTIPANGSEPVWPGSPVPEIPSLDTSVPPSNLSNLAPLASGAKTLANITKPISEWGADDWLSAIGKAAPGLLGAYASSEQASALSDLAKQQRDAENARYQDLVSRENTRYSDLKAREDAAIARQNEYMKLGMSREDARFAELKQRENEAIARQRGDIEYGRAQTQPYRTSLQRLMADPSSFLKSAEVTTPVQQGTDMLARSLSVGGNPIGSGNALQQLQDYSTKSLYDRLQGKQNQLAQFGGLSSFGSSGASIPGIGSSLPGGTSTSIPGIGSSLPGSATAGSNIGTSGGSSLSLASLESGNNVWNSLGAAANNIFTPQKSLAQQLAELKQAGVF